MVPAWLDVLAPLQMKFYWQNWSPVTEAKFEIFRFMFDPPPRIGMRLKATRHDQSCFALLADAAGESQAAHSACCI